ncbi:hypothetical protein AB0O00_20185, partial [Kitasatospora sp. NPDC093558]
MDGPDAGQRPERGQPVGGRGDGEAGEQGVRNGGSEYALNGQTCRLLDIQELLSDSGIGRE